MKQCLFPLLIAMSIVNAQSQNVRFLPLGDSYTICEGAHWEESWPYLLTAHLNAHNIPTELLGNPSVTGYTTQDLIDKELPLFYRLHPDFVTLLIGVNDYVQGKSLEQFAQNFKHILDYLEKGNSANCKILLITIPDFSVTPNGTKYAKGRNVREDIGKYNAFIKEEAKRRKLEVVDIFPSALKMQEDASLISEDGLHPSAKEYANWEKLIFPVAEKVVKKKL